MKDICFSIEKFTYIKDCETLNLDFLSKIEKRRLSKYDKTAIFLLNKTYDEKVENMVFSSRYGEIDRLNTLIEQHNELGEVSPNTFSSSVHNFPVGFFSVNKQITIPSAAVSSCADTFSVGLLNAILTKEANTLFCHVFEGGGVCMQINKTKDTYKINKDNNNNKTAQDNIDSFAEFLESKKSEISFPFYKIERILS